MEPREISNLSDAENVSTQHIERRFIATQKGLDPTRDNREVTAVLQIGLLRPYNSILAYTTRPNSIRCLSKIN